MSGSTRAAGRCHWRRLRAVLAAIALISVVAPSWAGEADVVKATAARLDGENWRITVTVRHGDAGWSHYADAWEVVAPGGKVLGTRVLYHPHETEQPFTRSLSPVRIPAAVRRVTIRARDKIHGFGGRAFTLDLPR